MFIRQVDSQVMIKGNAADEKRHTSYLTMIFVA
jgi:hypothetical protein